MTTTEVYDDGPHRSFYPSVYYRELRDRGMDRERARVLTEEWVEKRDRARTRTFVSEREHARHREALAAMPKPLIHDVGSG